MYSAAKAMARQWSGKRMTDPENGHPARLQGTIAAKGTFPEGGKPHARRFPERRGGDGLPCALCPLILRYGTAGRQEAEWHA
jgi:hypothetical protein